MPRNRISNKRIAIPDDDGASTDEDELLNMLWIMDNDNNITQSSQDEDEAVLRELNSGNHVLIEGEDGHEA